MHELRELAGTLQEVVGRLEQSSRGDVHGLDDPDRVPGAGQVVALAAEAGLLVCVDSARVFDTRVDDGRAIDPLLQNTAAYHNWLLNLR